MRAAALAAGLAAAWPVSPAPAQQTPPRPPAAPVSAAPAPADSAPIDVASEVSKTLSADETALRAGATPTDREEAARRLMARQNTRADTVILTVIQNNPLALQAVAHVLPEDPTPDPKLIEPLRGLLATSKAEAAVQDAARALASYRGQPAALQYVIEFVTPNAPDTAGLRAAAARGLAASTDPRAAGVLVRLLTDARQPGVVRTAAADALVAMTGLRANGQDPAAWQRWWDANANKPPEQFKADLLDQARRPQLQAADVLPFLRGLKATAKPESRADFLVQSLSAPDPATRGAAVLLVGEEFDTTGTLVAAVKSRLRDLVRDGSPEVRQLVAQTLFRINDQAALVPLLAQLDQEPDPTVRAEQIKAVAQIGDARAVPRLLALLDDGAAPTVAAAAAAALGARDLVPVIRRSPALLIQVRGALLTKIEGAPNVRPAPEPVRSACVEALGQLNLKDPGLDGLFLRLLDPKEPAAVRRAALQALAVLGNDKTIPAIQRMLRDEDRDVKLAAINALGSVAPFSRAGDSLFDFFGSEPPMERDRVVIDAAWKTFQKLLPTADEPLLIEWANQQFKSKPKYKVIMLEALADKQEKAGKPQDVASTWETIGSELMKITQPEQAAQYYGRALDYWLANGGIPSTIDSLMQSKVRALLAARRYVDAVKFVQDMSARDPNYRKIGTELANKAEKLLETGDYGGAHDLAAEALKIPNDLLTDRFRVRLDQSLKASDEMLKRAPRRADREPGAGLPP